MSDSDSVTIQTLPPRDNVLNDSAMNKGTFATWWITSTQKMNVNVSAGYAAIPRFLFAKRLPNPFFWPPPAWLRKVQSHNTRSQSFRKCSKYSFRSHIRPQVPWRNFGDERAVAQGPLDRHAENARKAWQSCRSQLSFLSRTLVSGRWDHSLPGQVRLRDGSRPPPSDTPYLPIIDQPLPVLRASEPDLLASICVYSWFYFVSICVHSWFITIRIHSWFDEIFHRAFQ